MRFLKTSIFSSAALGMLALTACESENLDVQPASSDVVQIHATIGGMDNANTRVPVLDENGIGEFQVGDVWDLYVYDAKDWNNYTVHNEPYSYGENTLLWDEIVGDEVTFTAVYPDMVWLTPRPEQPSALLELNFLELGNAVDILYASTTVRRGEPVHLGFRHLMHNIVINLEAEGPYVTESELDDAIIEMAGPVGNFVLDWLTGEIDYDAIPSEDLQYATWYMNQSRTASFIVPPQDLRYQLVVEIMLNGRVAQCQIPLVYTTENTDFLSYRLESGMRHVLNLKLYRNEPAGDLQVTCGDTYIQSWADRGSMFPTEVDIELTSVK